MKQQSFRFLSIIHLIINNNISLVLILLSLFSYTLFSCSSSQQGSNNRIFRFRLLSDPPTLDPLHTTDTASASVVFRMFEGLVSQDPATLETVPALADSWNISDDGLTYTFYLKHDVTFHNGRSLTSDDFRWSFERVLTPANLSERSWVLSPIKGADEMLAGEASHLAGMKTPDDYTVILELEKPFAPFLSYLSMEAAFAVAHESVSGESFTPIGTGPYRFIEWLRDIRVSVEAFNGYHNGVPDIKRVDFEIIPDIGVAFQKFVVGELDFVNETPPGQLQLIKERYPESVHVWPYLRIEYIGFNLTRPPFKGNLKLRQAFSYAVNRKELAEELFETAAVPATSILPPGIPGRDSTITGYQYNLEKAKELLADAGYPEGEGLPELTLWYNTNEMHQMVCQVIQSQLSKIGVTIRLKSLDWPAYLKACENHEPDMYRLGWVADIPDADNFLYILLDSQQIGPAGNYSGYSNPEFDSLVEEARSITDNSRRVALYKKAERMATMDAPWIMIVYRSVSVLFNDEYDGLVYAKQGDFRIPIKNLTRKNNGSPTGGTE